MPDLILDMEADLDRIKPEFEIGQPRIVSFHAPLYPSSRGDQTNLAIHVRIENGDVYGLLRAISENGGIGGEDDKGVYRFIPWPCAAVEVRTVSRDATIGDERLVIDTTRGRGGSRRDPS